MKCSGPRPGEEDESPLNGDLLHFVRAADVDSPDFYTALERFDRTNLADLLALAEHHDPDVRRALVSTLPFIVPDPDDELLAVVIQLTVDPAISVRDHACFVLAQQWREIDTDAVREALADRLDDLDRDTRSEALVGLAYRLDPRATPRVRDALSRPTGTVWRLELVAAGALGDPRLHPLVLQHLDGWEEENIRTVEAVRRLTDPAGVGAELFRGVADLYRARAHSGTAIEDLSAWRLMNEMLDIDPRRAREFFVAVSARLAGDDAALLELQTNSAISSEFWV